MRRCSLSGRVVEAASQDLQAHGTVPSDGRLRGPDYTATVTRVAWPQSVGSVSNLFGPPVYVAGSGHRLVVFTLSVTQPPADSGQLNSTTEVTATVQVGDKELPVSLDLIDGQITELRAGFGRSHWRGQLRDVGACQRPRSRARADRRRLHSTLQSVDLEASPAEPDRPLPSTRHPRRSAGTAAGPFHLSFTNPADGFSSTDDAQVTSAQLTYFAPGTTLQTPKSPNDAYLVLGIQSSYPDIPYGQPNSGHFFSSFNPMAGTELTFTPNGGSAVDGPVEQQCLRLDQRGER